MFRVAGLVLSLVGCFSHARIDMKTCARRAETTKPWFGNVN